MVKLDKTIEVALPNNISKSVIIKLVGILQKSKYLIYSNSLLLKYRGAGYHYIRIGADNTWELAYYSANKTTVYLKDILNQKEILW